MVVYTTDKNFVYAGTREARESPREPGVPILTIHDSASPPPRDAMAGHVWQLVDGEWVETVDNRGVTYWTDRETSVKIRELGIEVPEGATLEQPPLPPPTFEQVVEAKMADLTAAYIAEITGDVEYDGVIYQGDQRSLDALLSRLRIGVDPPYWRAKDNSDTAPFTLADVEALAEMIELRAATAVETLHSRKDAVLGIVALVEAERLASGTGLADEEGAAAVQAVTWE